MKKIIFYILLLGALTTALWIGAKPNSRSSSSQYLTNQPTLTPQPTTLQLGDTSSADHLLLTVNQAFRVPQPGQLFDLAIIQVSFQGTDACISASSSCTFYRQNFRITWPTAQQPISPAGSPTQYIPNVKLVHLAPIRSLTPRTSETGQIYFLIPKDQTQFNLSYLTQQTALPEYSLQIN